MKNSTTVMEHKGFKAKIMEAERLVGESIHNLPPGTPLSCYPAEVFKSYPENWMKGPGVFVVPVQPNKGLWFDWRDNDQNNTAVIPTVKGCNPITGMQTTGFHLERYDNKCPKHGCDFEAHRFCPECGYKWPDRGYVSGNPMWWDGFRSEDGSVRQFFFTEDMMRDVATHMIGKENTVPAFGFAFYSPKVPRSSYIPFNHIYHITNYGSSMHTIFPEKKTYFSNSLGIKANVKYRSISKSFDSPTNALYSAATGQSVDAPLACSAGFVGEDFSADTTILRERGITLDQVTEPCPAPKKEVAVGAGAKIRQELPEDSYPLDSWKDTPDSVMTIYFVFQEEFDKMASDGFKDFRDCEDGMLKGIPVG